MARLEWDPSLETGFGDIDEQHRKVFEKLESLLEAIEREKSHEVVASLFDFLIDYTSRHFSTEEDIMVAMGYPDIENHKREHDAFIIEMVRICSTFIDKRQALLLSIRLGTRVVTWLHRHITTTDAAMAKWFREQGSTRSAR